MEEHVTPSPFYYMKELVCGDWPSTEGARRKTLALDQSKPKITQGFLYTLHDSDWGVWRVKGCIL